MRRWIPVIMFFFAISAIMTGGYACDGPKSETTTEAKKEGVAEATPEEQTVTPEEQTVTPEEQTVTPEEQVVTPEETVADGGNEVVPETTTETTAETTTETTAETTTEPTTEGGTAQPDPAAAAQITAVRGGTAGNINKVAVTFLKPAIPSASTDDPAGFFVQATQDGPALFVAVDPNSTTPALKVGDIISFKADTIADLNGHKDVTAISNLTVDGSGYDVTQLIQDVSAKNDLTSALDNYESELISLDGTFKGAFRAAGAAYSQINIETAGVVGDTKLLVRVPTIIASLVGSVDGCTFSVKGVMWRFTTNAQVSFFSSTAVTLKTCPAPKLLSAKATSATTVMLTFDRTLDATSVLGSSQFTFDKGLTATSTSVVSDTVEVTTSQQTASEAYTVTVATTVKDALGTALDATANTATFTGYKAFTSALIINEILADPPTTNGDANKDGTRDSSQDEFIEIVNISTAAVNLSGYKILSGTTVVHTFGANVSLAAGKALVVFGGGMTADTQVNTNMPHTGFGGSLVYTSSAGNLSLGNSGKVIELQDASGTVLDTLEYKSSGDCEGDADVSVNRAPDLAPYTCQKHNTITNATGGFTPGTKVDGTNF